MQFENIWTAGWSLGGNQTWNQVSSRKLFNPALSGKRGGVRRNNLNMFSNPYGNVHEDKVMEVRPVLRLPHSTIGLLWCSGYSIRNVTFSLVRQRCWCSLSGWLPELCRKNNLPHFLRSCSAHVVMLACDNIKKVGLLVLSAHLWWLLTMWVTNGDVMVTLWQIETQIVI